MLELSLIFYAGLLAASKEIKMTNIGYDYILQQISQMTIVPPKDLTANELTRWLNGYQACMNSIVKMIVELKNDNERS